jgi:hypothetical protein
VFTWDVAISRWLDGVAGWGLFRTAEMPWTVIAAVALVLTWMLWVTGKNIGR